MSLGYCKTYSRGLNSNGRAGVLSRLSGPGVGSPFTPNMPDRCKLIGISFSPTENTNSNLGSNVNTIQTLKFYDGDSGSADSLIFTFPIILNFEALSANAGDFIMQNDSYIQIENGLYWSPSYNGMGNTIKPILVTVFYV